MCSSEKVWRIDSESDAKKQQQFAAEPVTRITKDGKMGFMWCDAFGYGLGCFAVSESPKIESSVPGVSVLRDGQSVFTNWKVQSLFKVSYLHRVRRSHRKLEMRRWAVALRRDILAVPLGLESRSAFLTNPGCFSLSYIVLYLLGGTGRGFSTKWVAS